VEIFQKRGDKRIIYFDGLKLFGPGDASLLPDDLHPNNEGYRLMGERAAEKLLPRLTDML
jgi:lysophospholipase L1-like esterase